MTISEKTAYLKGLMEGLSFDKDTPEGKILSCMADILSDLALSVSDAEDDIEAIKEYAEEIDDDLTDLEDYVFDEDDEDEYGEDYDEDPDEDEEDEEDFVEVECPNCGETVFFNPEDIDPENIICPSCNESFSCICDECDGDCDSCEEDCDARNEEED